MKRNALLITFAIITICQLAAKPNLEKDRKKLIGQWQFFREYCYKPVTVKDFIGSSDYYRLTKDKCLDNTVYDFKEDGTFTTTQVDSSISECPASSGTWEMFVATDAQGKTVSGVKLLSVNGMVISSFMVVETSENYFIMAFLDKGIPNGKDVRGQWFNSYKRYPISAEDQARLR